MERHLWQNAAYNKTSSVVGAKLIIQGAKFNATLLNFNDGKNWIDVFLAAL